MKILTVLPGPDGIWYVVDDDEERWRLFNTNTLPTPFTTNVPGDQVVKELRRLYPEKAVRLG